MKSLFQLHKKCWKFCSINLQHCKYRHHACLKILRLPVTHNTMFLHCFIVILTLIRIVFFKCSTWLIRTVRWWTAFIQVCNTTGGFLSYISHASVDSFCHGLFYWMLESKICSWLLLCFRLVFCVYEKCNLYVNRKKNSTVTVPYICVSAWTQH